MLVRGSNTEKFNHALVVLNQELANCGKLNLLSQAVHAEDFYLRILNKLYGKHLVNDNERNPNAEAVDLIDEDANLFVQVTITCDIDKVNRTLGKRAMRSYADQNFHAMFLFVGRQPEKPNSIKKSKAIKNPYGVQFDQSVDLLFTVDLVERFAHRDVELQKEILHLIAMETGDSSYEPDVVDAKTIQSINAHLEERKAYHPSFRLMGEIDRGLLPKGVIPNAERTVVPDGGEPISFGEFIGNSWNSESKCHLLITGEGGVGKTVALLTLATERDFLPHGVAAIYIPLYELAQYCGEGADRDCIDRFLESDLQASGATLDNAKQLASQTWDDGPKLVLLLDGYNEIPDDRRRAVNEGIKKWAMMPGVQVITTSRELGGYGFPYMQKLELRPLSDDEVRACLGSDTPDSDSRVFKAIHTPLMLRLYTNSIAFKRDDGVRQARYLRLADADSAGNLIWNYLQWELFRSIENRQGGLSRETYAIAILLVAPYVCWKMESKFHFSIEWDDLGDFTEEACLFWYGKTKPSGKNRTLRLMLQYLDKPQLDMDELIESLRDALTKEVALFVEKGASDEDAAHTLLIQDGAHSLIQKMELCFEKMGISLEKETTEENETYFPIHQNFRDCLAALHVRNAIESNPEAVPEELHNPLSPSVERYLAELADDELLDKAWEANRGVYPTNATVTHNLLETIGGKRSGNLTGLDWSGMDLTHMSLVDYWKEPKFHLSQKPIYFNHTKLGTNCFMPARRDCSASSVCFSPDGNLLAISSHFRAVWLYDISTSQVAMAPLEGPMIRALSICFSPDGCLHADGAITYLWDISTGKVSMMPLEEYRAGLNAACFSPDGSLLAYGFNDGIIQLWDASTGELAMAPLQGHGGWVTSLCFSPDGCLLASGSDDGIIRLWDASTGELALAPLRGHSGWVTSLHFSPDGRLLASGSTYGTVRLWDASRGELATSPLEGHRRAVKTVCFSPDGRLLASGSYDGAVRLWDTSTGEPTIAPLEGHRGWVRSVCFSPDGCLIASCSDDGTARLWDVSAGESIRTITPLYGINLIGLDFSLAEISDEDKEVLRQNGVRFGHPI